LLCRTINRYGRFRSHENLHRDVDVKPGSRRLDTSFACVMNHTLTLQWLCQQPDLSGVAWGWTRLRPVLETAPGDAPATGVVAMRVYHPLSKNERRASYYEKGLQNENGRRCLSAWRMHASVCGGRL
jgi:hypothetical protein